MKIKEMFNQTKPVVSFEVFPPKPDYPLTTIYNTIEQLQNLKPDFISVTYGAGGSNRERTVQIASHIKKDYQVETMAHLTGIGRSSAEIDQVVDDLIENGVENILALRGDPPGKGQDTIFKPGPYRYARQLVEHLRKKDRFCIGAAAYPEGHIECDRWEKNWLHLREKVLAGVDFLVTQLYFDNRVFYNFRENLIRLGVNVPISAGIMPVLNPAQIKRMVYLSGASIPAKLLMLFEKYENQPADFEKAGLDYAIQQINELIKYKVDGIHIYTMNRAEQTRIIVENIDL